MHQKAWTPPAPTGELKRCSLVPLAVEEMEKGEKALGKQGGGKKKRKKDREKARQGRRQAPKNNK